MEAFGRRAGRGGGRLPSLSVLLLVLHHSLDDGVICWSSVVDEALDTLSIYVDTAWQSVYLESVSPSLNRM